MKNILSENMLRFATKNLSESAKKDLIVKSIMETIDQHGLHREVKRKLAEQAEPTSFGPVAVNKFYVNSGAVSINNTPMNPTGDRSPSQTVNVSVAATPKNPNVYAVSFKFVNTQGKPVNMVADVQKTNSGSWMWVTSFNNLIPSSTLNGLNATMPNGQQGPVADLFAQMAVPGRPADTFMIRDLKQIGFPFKNPIG